MTDIRIPFVDLYPEECREAVGDAVARVLRSRRYILGPEVEAFEAEWAAYCGAAYCVGVGNGFDALLLALKAHRCEWAGAFVPGNTCLPTWLAAYEDIGIEPDADTYQMDVMALAAALDEEASNRHAIIPVHLYGIPADIATIEKIARRFGMVVIEDCAQAHGAEFLGRRIGSHGHTCAWSFYPTKNLGAFGDAGAVTTDDAAIADAVRSLLSYGREGAVNSRLDEMQAAILRAKLPYLDGWNEQRRRNARQYLTGLADVPGVILPVIPDYANPCWHLFVIRHPRRDALQAHLSERGIETMVHYPVPPHKALGRDDNLPITERLCAEVVSLPVGPHLNEEHIATVINAVGGFAE
jgi:dTDP-4-amino-4,6-dideoxygalactose transaminase